MYYLKQIVDNLDAGVVICDKHKEIIVWNQKASDIIHLNSTVTPKEKWLNYFKVFDMSGKKIPGDKYPLMKASDGITTKNERVLIKNSAIPEGVYCSFNSFPIYDEDGSLAAGAVVFSDITQQIKLEGFLQDLGVRFEHIKKLIEDHLPIIDLSKINI